MHKIEDLITIFNQCFVNSHQTILISGDDEPIYLPADATNPYHRIIFAHGFFSSALHECAHWLIAGEARRLQVDYGYWYIPDGRTAAQQKLFQQVEIKPQALEWILSIAAGYRFQFSIDNLTGETADLEEFKQNVYEQRLVYERDGLPERAQRFKDELITYYS